MGAPPSPGPLAALTVRGDGARAVPPWLGGDRPVTHLRVGSSTCGALLPEVGDLLATAREAREGGGGLELATPPCSDVSLAKVRRLVETLTDREITFDLVANDWGVLSTYGNLENIRMVAGRLLNHQFKDPRVVEADPERLGTRPPTWSLGAATSPSWQALARDLGVERVELDWPLHGLDTQAWSRTGFDLSLHLPRVLVACGRTCVHRSPGGEVDRPAGSGCERPCERREFDLDSPGDGVAPRRMRRGRCDLVELDPASRRRAIAWADRPDGPDRIVLARGIKP